MLILYNFTSRTREFKEKEEMIVMSQADDFPKNKKRLNAFQQNQV